MAAISPGVTGRVFGDTIHPLLLSVRSGARASMPGMMDTVLNLGLNDQSVHALGHDAGDARFAWDSYRRFIQMYGDVVMGVDHDVFEEILEDEKARLGHEQDTELSAVEWQHVIARYKEAIEEALDHVGVLTVEFFACAEGPVVNEIAPRVHNSGHWTIEGAQTSQFEQHLRAILGLPLGDPSLVSARASMENLIGPDVERWSQYVAEPGAHLHLYGKGEARPGRKMGHVTRLDCRK